MIFYFIRLKVDQDKWENITEDSSKELKAINKEFDRFKNKLLLNKIEEFEEHVNWFESLKFDSIFEYVSVKRLITNIIIINVIKMKI